MRMMILTNPSLRLTTRRTVMMRRKMMTKLENQKKGACFVDGLNSYYALYFFILLLVWI
ncbi:hypothetical protein HanOQP8_Chr12g0444601 [Helianthus annuus]|nr:hypothetical protein HanOQP8_Chr12g0444601 [Helianthus annuus]